MSLTNLPVINKQRMIERLNKWVSDEIQVEESHEKKKQLESFALMLRFLPKRNYTEKDHVVPSALVSLRTGGMHAYYFVVPQGGGWVTDVDGIPLQMITPQSPLGEKLIGKKVGEKFTVKIRGGERQYEVLSIC